MPNMCNFENFSKFQISMKIEDIFFSEIYGKKISEYIMDTFKILTEQEEFKTSWNNKLPPHLVINRSHSTLPYVFPCDHFGDIAYGRYDMSHNMIEIFYYNLLKTAIGSFPKICLNQDDNQDVYRNIARYLAVLIFTTIVHEFYHTNQYMGRTAIYNKTLFRYHIEEPVEYMTSKFIESHPDLFKACTGVDSSLICFNLPRDINTNYITQESYEKALTMDFGEYNKEEILSHLFPY